MADEQPRKRLTFDPTINAGHLLTTLTFVGAIAMGWNLLDKRVTVLEEAKLYQRERDAGQDKVVGEKMDSVKESLKELKVSVDRIDQKVRP